MGGLVVLMCLLCCGYGLVLIFAKDSAWSYVSWRNRNAGIASERTNQWNASATFQGVVLIVVGLGLLLLLPHQRPTAQGPKPGDVTYTVDGHPATPEEQEAIRQQIQDHSFGGATRQTPSPGH